MIQAVVTINVERKRREEAAIRVRKARQGRISTWLEAAPVQQKLIFMSVMLSAHLEVRMHLQICGVYACGIYLFLLYDAIRHTPFLKARTCCSTAQSSRLDLATLLRR